MDSFERYIASAYKSVLNGSELQIFLLVFEEGNSCLLALGSLVGYLHTDINMHLPFHSFQVISLRTKTQRYQCEVVLIFYDSRSKLLIQVSNWIWMALSQDFFNFIVIIILYACVSHCRFWLFRPIDCDHRLLCPWKFSQEYWSG